MGAIPDERELVQLLPRVLSELVGDLAGEVEIALKPQGGADARVRAAPYEFLVEYSRASGAGPVARAARQLKEAAEAEGGGAIPLVVVPYMGEAGQRTCQRLGVGWLDLSGNGRILAPGLRVLIEGRPNRFPARGRPPSAFAPKSSRVARLLLMRPNDSFRQRDISIETGVSESFVSRIVSRLEDEGYLDRQADDSVRVRDPALLLDAWQEEYDFGRHRLIKGHVPARSGAELAHRVDAALAGWGKLHAATGLAAAWQLVQFASFRISSFYVEALPDAQVRNELGFREEESGANLWLLLPDDEGVFQGAGERGGIRCVHPVQAYLDLAGHPERASEAAGVLRKEVLGW